MIIIGAFGFQLSTLSLVAVFVFWGLLAKYRVHAHWLCSPLVFFATFVALGWLGGRFDFSAEWPIFATSATVVFVSGMIAWVAAFGRSKSVQVTFSSSVSSKD